MLDSLRLNPGCNFRPFGVQIRPHMVLNMRALHFYEIQIGYKKQQIKG
jgi:hypothetical protein